MEEHPAAGREDVPGWERPTWCRVYRRDVLVYAADLRDLRE